ncbi:Peroxidase 3 [Hordeum vulgare]|nr:Peroxidase 3 [Hordeum vulgare]
MASAVPLPVMLLVGVAVMLVGSGAGAAGVRGGRRQGQLRVGFYDKSCPAAERIVGDYVRQHVRRVPTVAPALLRTHYHDCFVRVRARAHAPAFHTMRAGHSTHVDLLTARRVGAHACMQGCDGSILLNSTAAGAAEKDAPPNLSLRGFDLVDRVKGLVEEACPGVVSCADVLALAARDAVAAIGGPSWRVPTGRRDGTVSTMQDAVRELPSPSMTFPQLVALFAGKGLDVRDLVWLSGAHTIGIAHCSSFADRLYSYPAAGNGNGTGAVPPLDAAYAANLRQRKCRMGGRDAAVEMDPGSYLTFDLGYYHTVLKHRALFRSDAALVTDAAARADIAGVVASPPEVFFQVFARSMARLGAVQRYFDHIFVENGGRITESAGRESCSWRRFDEAEPDPEEDARGEAATAVSATSTAACAAWESSWESAPESPTSSWELAPVGATDIDRAWEAEAGAASRAGDPPVPAPSPAPEEPPTVRPPGVVLGTPRSEAGPDTSDPEESAPTAGPPGAADPGEDAPAAGPPGAASPEGDLPAAPDPNMPGRPAAPDPEEDFAGFSAPWESIKSQLFAAVFAPISALFSCTLSAEI